MDSKLLEAKLAEQAERYDGKSFFSHQPTPSPTTTRHGVRNEEGSREPDREQEIPLSRGTKPPLRCLQERHWVQEVFMADPLQPRAERE